MIKYKYNWIKYSRFSEKIIERNKTKMFQNLQKLICLTKSVNKLIQKPDLLNQINLKTWRNLQSKIFIYFLNT